MPSKKGYLIQKFPFQYLHLKKDIHNHSFPVPIPDKGSFDLKVKLEEDRIAVMLKNLKIPHSVPTADNGRPKYYVTVELFNRGKPVYRERYLITSKDPLNYREEKLIDFYIFEDFTHLKITVERKLSWSKKREKVLEKTFRKGDILASP